MLLDVIHKFTRDNYAKRFPELESLIHTPMEYIKTVKVSIFYIVYHKFCMVKNCVFVYRLTHKMLIAYCTAC